MHQRHHQRDHQRQGGQHGGDAKLRPGNLKRIANAERRQHVRRQRWTAAGEELTKLEGAEQEKLRLLDLWSFQKKEIEGAGPVAADICAN